MNINEIERRAKECEIQLAVVCAMESIGLSSGEITYNRGCQTYGAWFKDAVNKGKITPCRRGLSSGRTRYYSVREILSLKALELQAFRDNN